MIQNNFFLIAGVTALFFSAGHALWGERYVLEQVRSSGMPVLTKHMLAVIWNQPTVFHGLSAVVLVMAAMSPDDKGYDALAVFIGLVSFGFFLNYVGASLIKNRAALVQIIPQTFALMLYLGVIAAGIQV